MSVLLVDDDEATNFINRRIIENLELQIILKSLIMAKEA
jgi:response regulator of citrate/malate metabolism